MKDARTRQREQRLEAVYAEIPAIACKGLCHEACGIILMTPLEARRLPLPSVKPGVASPGCPLLGDDNRCRSYANRPLACRLYGVAAGLPCEFGCAHERVLADSEAGELIGRVVAIGGGPPVVSHDVVVRKARANSC